MNKTLKPVALDIIGYVEQNILPEYKNFDKAHREDHVIQVIECSLNIAQYYDVDKDMVYVIAAYHDLGLENGREFHHIDSGKILMKDEMLKKWFKEEQLLVMRDAIEDHRASGKDEPRSIYGKIVAEADRVIDVDITLRRTVQFGLSHYKQYSYEEQFGRFNNHLEEKYAEGGYLKLWIPESPNGDKLKELRNIISDKIKLRNIFDSIYKEESEL